MKSINFMYTQVLLSCNYNSTAEEVLWEISVEILIITDQSWNSYTKIEARYIL